jgi:8-oxo-dGTP pyrophosphatase MutT (NUDIX family)
MSNTDLEQYRSSNERVEIPTRFSVAMLVEKAIEKHGLSILLVRQTKSSLWGPPAGGLKLTDKGNRETPKQAMDRELSEEASLALDADYWRSTPERIGAIDISGRDYPRVGYIFQGRLLESKVYDWPAQKPTNETDSWLFATPDKLGELISEGSIYRPEINVPLLQWWIKHRGEDGVQMFLELPTPDQIKFLEKIRQEIEEDLIPKKRDFKVESRVKTEGGHDKYAIRLIVNSVGECYEALDKVGARYKVVRERDYIKRPWKNGYMSIHIDLEIEGKPVEIQIRTREMHAASERLIATFGLYYWRRPGFSKL